MNAVDLGGAHPLRLPSVRWLLLLVVLMAMASATALWLTLQQARELGRPNQHADLWWKIWTGSVQVGINPCSLEH